MDIIRAQFDGLLRIARELKHRLANGQISNEDYRREMEALTAEMRNLERQGRQGFCN